MQKTYSNSPLERIAYFGRGEGKKADVYLRENIEEITVPAKEDGEERTKWCADEVHIKTTLPEEEVAENFDELWVRAEVEGKSIEERLDECDELIGALIEVALEG